ncbi:protein of unknown function [Xenorhabdus doucetiae]|uniref:Uncharacterized protein n=1 Tax=Xenorhabdus doucetiae TaxID=351671 RepID=A0A068QTI5_9GAMM|nr:protein of unknown function [Xenorhabdus doucetiae]
MVSVSKNNGGLSPYLRGTLYKDPETTTPMRFIPVPTGNTIYAQ